MSKGDLQAVAWQGDYCELWAQRRTANELASSGGPEGLEWRAHEAKRSAQSKAAKRLEARGAHEARALWAKQRVVSPMRQGAPQASLRAMRNDHAELWPRPKGVRSAGTPRRRRRGRCEDTEHRASEVQGGAKTQDDYAELRSWHTTRQRNFTQPALSQRKETGLVLLCVYYSPTMANRPLSMSSAS